MSQLKPNISIGVCPSMSLDIYECRGTSTVYQYHAGEERKATISTRTAFHWRLKGLASKLDPSAKDFAAKDQEVYGVSITSSNFDFGSSLGFRHRSDALENAMEFAARHGIEVDGYELRDDGTVTQKETDNDDERSANDGV